jgi:hypothetical protein
LPVDGTSRSGLQSETIFQLKPGGEPPSAQSCKLRRGACLVGRLTGTSS